MLFRWAGFQKFAIWVSLMDGGTAPTPGPPPSSGNILYWGVDDLQWGAANQITWG